MSELYELIRGGPTHPPFLFSLTKKHGDLVAEGGASSAADALALGAGKMLGGIDAGAEQSYATGIGRLSVDTMAPLLRRGVLLDIARLLGVEALDVEFAIGPERLEDAAKAQGVEVRAGDVALLRTGWAQYWDQAARYITGGRGNQAAGPGRGIHIIEALNLEEAARDRAYEFLFIAAPLRIRGGGLADGLTLEFDASIAAGTERDSFPGW